jgi:hypothetical protein
MLQVRPVDLRAGRSADAAQRLASRRMAPNSRPREIIVSDTGDRQAGKHGGDSSWSSAGRWRRLLMLVGVVLIMFGGGWWIVARSTANFAPTAAQAAVPSQVSPAGLLARATPSCQAMIADGRDDSDAGPCTHLVIDRPDDDIRATLTLDGITLAQWRALQQQDSYTATCLVNQETDVESCSDLWGTGLGDPQRDTNQQRVDPVHFHFDVGLDQLPAHLTLTLTSTTHAGPSKTFTADITAS